MSQRGIDLLYLLSPRCSLEDARAILDGRPTPTPAPRREAKTPPRRVAHDLRQQLYLPPTGSMAWALLGHQVIR